jgi:hypothetical protein
MTIDEVRKFIVIAVIVVIILVIGIFLIPILTRGQGNITINTIPEGANITIDGKSYKSPAKLTEISGGSHKIKIMKEGFKIREDEIFIRKNDTTEITLRLYTNEVTPTVLHVAILNAEKQLSDLQKLIQFLPFGNIKFHVEHQAVGGQPSVVITLYAILNKPSQYESYKKQIKQYGAEALKWIESKGIDTENLDIIWKPEDPNIQ